MFIIVFAVICAKAINKIQTLAAVSFMFCAHWLINTKPIVLHIIKTSFVHITFLIYLTNSTVNLIRGDEPLLIPVEENQFDTTLKHCGAKLRRETGSKTNKIK